MHASVHRLVCAAFHGISPFRGAHAAHKDGKSLRNLPDNLYWATPKQNVADKKKHGRHICGEKTPWSVLRDIDIPLIRKRLLSGDPWKQIGRDFNVSKSCIWKIRMGHSWKHL